MFRSINPCNDEVIRDFSEHSLKDVELILDQAIEAQAQWAKEDIVEKSKLIRNIGQVLKKYSSQDAELMALEMGKPLKQGESEIGKCALLTDYYADHASKHLEEIIIETEAKSSYVTFEPLGVVLAIMPWNFPFWQVCRFAVPALLAGNAVILKHSENTFGCAERIEGIFHEAGIPKDLFRSIRVQVEDVQKIIENRKISAVSLTGSTRAGKAVASQAGAALKPCVLELGGSDPYLILKDANLELATEACVTSRLLNSGQSCIAAKRFIVEESIHDEFVELLVQKLKRKVVGNPLDDGVDVGPLARKDLRDELHRQVSESIQDGAHCLMGGVINDQAGAFYPITLLTGVQKGMPVYEEELFGPVASVIKAKNSDHAVEISNDSVYGLGAAVFSNDLQKAEYIARSRINAGSCFVNDFVRSDPRLPFGGIKESGFGRELSEFGIREFVNVKTVYIS